MLIEKCPRCGESLVASTLGATMVSCGRCSGAFVMAQVLAAVPEEKSAGAGEVIPAPPTIEVPPHFRDRYSIGEPLGRGAMGIVFRGRDLVHGRDIAIKVLLSASDDDLLARFMREAEVLASIEHPHLVQVVDLDQLGGHPCLITELLGGGTLRDRMDRPMAPDVVVRIAAECLSALDACHTAGIVHRDLKPDNILFGTDGTAKVADLGIAKVYGEGDRLTRTGAFIGTPRYMSPEQARGLPATASADIYAMGAIVYEMLAGERPLDGETLRDLLTAIIQKSPPPLDQRAPGVSAGLARVVHRALAKQPEERFETAGAFGLALRRAMDPASGPIELGKLNASDQARRAAIRHSAQRAIKSVVTSKPIKIPGSVSRALEPIAPATPAAVAAPPASAPETRPTPVRPTPVRTSGATSHRPRSGAVSRVVPPPAPARTPRAALAAAAGVLVLAVALCARLLLAPAPGDPATVHIYPGITGVQVVWQSAEACAAAVRAEAAASGASPVTVREEGVGREHSVTVTGLSPGGAYDLRLESGGRALFPPLRAQLGRALEIPSTVRVDARGPDDVEVGFDVPVPVNVSVASTSDPSLSVEAFPGPATSVRLRVKGPGAAAGLFDLQLRVAAVCGATAERTLRVTGGAERLRAYTASSRFVKDLEALDLDIRNRRFPLADRKQRAEERLKSFPPLAQLAADLPAMRAALTAPTTALARRAKLYEVLAELLVMEKLLEARLNVPDPGLSLPKDSLVSRLVEARKLADRFAAAGFLVPAGARPAGTLEIFVAGEGKGALVARGPGQENARAAVRSMVGAMVEVSDVISVKVQRRALPPGVERVRLSIIGRCLESHVLLNVQVNRTWKLRFFGSSLGFKPGHVAAVDFMSSQDDVEKNQPRQTLWLDVPAALFSEGENTLEITAQTLVAELGANTVFCAPSVHEMWWGPVP